MIPAQQLERVLARVAAGELSLADQQRLQASLTAELVARCAADGWFWTKFMSTRDESFAAQAVRPFPREREDIHLVWDLLQTRQKMVMAKSRQMMASWVVAAFMTWWARSKPNQACYYQCKAFEDAVAMVAMPEGGFQGRCQFIESHLPDWLRVGYKASEGRIQYDNGSLIQGLAGGSDKIRGKVASIIVEDESAFQEDQEGVFTAVMPLVQNGSKIVFVSTPNGENFFSTIFFGYALREGDAQAG